MDENPGRAIEEAGRPDGELPVAVPLLVGVQSAGGHRRHIQDGSPEDQGLDRGPPQAGLVQHRRIEEAGGGVRVALPPVAPRGAHM